MEIPGLGPVTKGEFRWYRSGRLAVPVLGGTACHFFVVGYDEDPVKADFHTAISAFLALDESALRAAAVPVFTYYQDSMAEVDRDDGGYVEIFGPEEVWGHVRAGGGAGGKGENVRDWRVAV